MKINVVRCRRLNRECRPAQSVRRRSPRKPAVSKTARLEEKLDGLVSLIKAGAQSGAVSTYQFQRASVSTNSHDYVRNVPVLTPDTDDFMDSSYNLLPSSLYYTNGEPSPAIAEEYLVNFRTYISKYSPFIYIPSTTTAQQLL